MIESIPRPGRQPRRSARDRMPRLGRGMPALDALSCDTVRASDEMTLVRVTGRLRAPARREELARARLVVDDGIRTRTIDPLPEPLATAQGDDPRWRAGYAVPAWLLAGPRTRLRLSDARGRELALPAAAEHADPAGLAAGTAAARAPVTARIDATWLRRGLARMSDHEPEAVARLVLQLLPAQGLVIADDLAYDLTITELGRWRVIVRAGRATVVPVSAHGRAADDEVDFHLMMDAATAGELVAGGRWARMLVDGRVRIRGKRRRARRLCALGGARLEASELDAVGVRPDPQLVLKAVGHALDPAWTRGYRFCLAIQVAGLSGGTWYAHVEDGATVAVTATAPPGGAAAAVRCEPAALLALLAGQRPAAETVLAVEGDRAAVDLAHAWMERAWRGEGRPARRRSRPLGVPAMMRGLAPSRLPELVFGARRARA